ncbi:aldose epimerase family protein [Leptothoe sp. PORK10 BA2]|uniref:aldose epimerase family protein n=1 Tax=Leptothoe sp. PORK10 BA2 TaxID=3110254 RepID=UPI002B1FBB1A|nr:aldose epimerase [Leptothoe sp. PORK10 BA2]MEA5464459.1 aldose epimerase [Leptothoe sp. PORK10 BA2]
MSTITTENQQYLTYILTDGDSQVAVVPERGGIITSWQVNGSEVLYMDVERFKDPSLSVRGGIPLLFPICGNLVDDVYTLRGETYSLQQHGFARTMPWTVTQQSTEDGASLTITLKSNDDTRAVYPFDFQLDYIYTLKGNTLEQRFRHTNLSEQPMPFSTGTHPYFAVVDKTKLSFDLPSSEYKIKGAPEVFAFNGQFNFDQEEIDFAFINLTGQIATVKDCDRTLTIAYDEHYPTLVFWTVKGKDFYCLEPWSGPRNAMNTGNALITVAPQDTAETVISMTVS